MKIPALFRARTPVFDAPLRPDESFHAIGDVHGCAGLLKNLTDKLPLDRWVFVGDYADRGERSADVFRILMELETTSDGRVICLAGNHESFLIDFLSRPDRTGPQWVRHGGLQTLASFGVSPPASVSATTEDWVACRDAFRGALGPELEAWIVNRPAVWRSGNVAVVHAGADPAVPIEDQSDGHLLWGHPDFETVPRKDGIWVVHGHTIVQQPVAIRGRIAIDTGAYATGRLTAGRIAQDGVSFVTT